MAPSIIIVKADKSLLLPAASEDQVHDLDKLRTETGPLALAAGQEHVHGLESLLNSVETEPLKQWNKEVSLTKNHQSVDLASFMVVH